MTHLFTPAECETLHTAMAACPAELRPAILLRLHEYRVQALVLDTLLSGYTTVAGLDEFGDVQLTLSDAGREAAR